jgi:hypothetical protein
MSDQQEQTPPDAREEWIGTLDRALAGKAVEPHCTRCGAKHWVWLDKPISPIDAEVEGRIGGMVTRVCSRCGSLDAYEVDLLMR